MTDEYVPDSGNITIDATEYNDVVKKVERSNNPQWTPTEERTLAGIITGYKAPTEGEQWRISLVDDYTLAATAGLYKELRDAEIAGSALGAVILQPAGDTAGMVETTLTIPIRVLYVSRPVMDADAETVSTAESILHCTGSVESVIV